jgi:hypothetical protein
VGVEIMLAILCSVLGGFPPDAKPVWAEQSKPIVILLDATANGFTYRIDGSPVPLSEIRRTLQRKWDKGKTHEEQARVIILMHEKVSFSDAENLRALTMAVGYDQPRTLYFGTDRRYMIELRYSDAVAFSATGPVDR